MNSRRKPKTLEIRKMNKQNIYEFIKENNGVSKQDIVYGLQLSLPTVTQNLTELEKEGLIDSSKVIYNTGGRNAAAYSFIKDFKVAVGLDITKNHVKAVVVNLSGKVVAISKERIPFSLSEAYFCRLGEIVQSILEKNQVDRKKVLGVGIAVPGLVSEDGQTIVYGKILGFTGVTCKTFSQFIPYPTLLFNDANAAGFAEVYSSQDLKNAFYICLSNNIGGSILINNKVYVGENQRSGEIGHTTIVRSGPPCFCGQKGCFEIYCAATVLSELTNGDLGAFFQELEKGNIAFLQKWKIYLENLAIVINNIRMLFDCHIIVGGYIGSYIEKYMEQLWSLIAERNMFQDDPRKFVLPCKCKIEAIATGAALPFIEKFIKSI